MRRREFITLLGGVATWPLAARAQQPERMRRVGVLAGLTESDPGARAWPAAFEEGLQKLGWSQGRNLRIDYRWAAGARLQANQTGRQSTEERQNLRTPKLLAQNRRSLCIDPVHLKNMLRQVQS